MNKTKLLIVEDDPNLGDILNEYLTVKGYDTTLKTDGEAGFQAFFSENDFDLCLFDVMLPKKDGFTLAQEIRKQNTEVPIIFLTAKSMKEDTIKGLKLGADDYLTKPFNMEELLLRIAALLKRSKKQESSSVETAEFKIGDFEFNTDTQELTVLGEKRKLTSKESELLKMLCQNLNSTLDRSIALKAIWHDDSYFNARSMDVYIAKLRKYLKEDEKVKIMTIHGQGFKLIEIK
ncbi:response regulator transcription factor [Aureibacter tunicatorum]|uniref:DNA-binding response OmpR family regulator n=1 Tax=Aureibacter tunicatorum TaxID=866807 RepID=A0AAE3XKM5_9BACT|nr:response regulator transcription factor [Aureibacter tunicatorum]MDR6237481.1 DNA-binding response OmpR family regulator [Aureibacter tunicatorum]BDD06470.1 DNA-binding response regulator [Aureibacter tunicatorum]